MKISTRDFGEVEIVEEDILCFPKGIPGFVEEKEFVLLPLGEDSPFLVMQSVNSPELALITLEPWGIVPDYEFEIDEQIEAALKIESTQDVMVLVIGTIHEELSDMTVNLAAPVVINHRERLGKQVILDGSDYPIRYPLFPREARQGVR